MDTFLEKKNDLNGADVSVFIGLHTILSALLVSSTWYLFYHMSAAGVAGASSKANLSMTSIESKSVLLKHLLSSSSPKTSKIQKKMSSLLEKIDSSKNSNKAIHFLQNKFPSIDPTRFTISYVEAKLVRLLLKPFTIPGRIWLSWKGTMTWKNYQTHHHSQQKSKTNLASLSLLDSTTLCESPQSFSPYRHIALHNEPKKLTQKQHYLTTMPCNRCITFVAHPTSSRLG